jgi:hypothetical protein
MNGGAYVLSYEDHEYRYGQSIRIFDRHLDLP